MDRLGLPSLPAMLAKFTTRPQPRSTMPGTHARIMFTVPITLTSSTRRHSATVVSSSGSLGPTIPAELTSTSTGPISLATCCTASSSVAAPSPLPPPVTSAVLLVVMSLPQNLSVGVAGQGAPDPSVDASHDYHR